MTQLPLDAHSRQLLDALGDAVFIWDRETRHFVDCNRKAVERYGYELDTLREMTPFDLHPESERGLVEHYLTLPGHVGVRRYHHRYRDGRLAEVEMRVESTHAYGRDALMAIVRDTTQEADAARAIEERDERYRRLFESSTDGIILMSSAGRLLEANRAAQDMFGLSSSEIIQRTLADLVPEDSIPMIEKTLENLEHGGDLRLEMPYQRQSEQRFAEISASSFELGGSRIIQAILRDTTNRREIEDRLVRQALHDQLTGLPNRTLFRDRLRMAIEQAKRRGERFAVLFVDLDRFKSINDTYGHSAGDRVLVNVARRFKGLLRPGDGVARIYGDEFALLLHKVKDHTDVMAIARRLEQALLRPMRIDDTDLVVTGSIGALHSDAGVSTVDQTLRDADAAMRRAKQSGGAATRLFETEMRASTYLRSDLEGDLRRATNRRELFLRYQPMIDLQTGYVAGFEALLRWQHPTRGELGPAEFLDLAEATGLLGPIGEWGLAEAAKRVLEWRELANSNELSVSVNLSNRQFSELDSEGFLAKYVEDIGLPPDALRLEITEGTLIESPAVEVLADLKDSGIRVYLDDFGTGYSSLSYLQRLTIDSVKIDRSFVRELGETARAYQIVQTIVALAHSLRLRVIAEGVETEQQLELLRGLKVDWAQGFYYAKPLLPDEAYRFLTDRLQTRTAS